MHRWSWRTVLHAFAAIAIFAAAGARAQTLNDAGSPSQASATKAPTSEETKQIQERRRVLFQQVLNDPSNLDVAFEYAGLSARAGDVEAAIATLERMLIFAPGLPRLQLELGVLYFRLGAYETARSYFQNALSAPHVPDVVKARVDPYLSAIDDRTKGYTFHGLFQSGIRYQTNANAGPNGTVRLNVGGTQLPFELDNQATGTPDYNAFASANLALSIDMHNQGDRFNVNLATYGAWYKERHDLDLEVAELKAGPLFDLERFGLKDSALGLYGIGSGILLDGDPYLGAVGAGSNFTAPLTSHTRLYTLAEYRREEYLNSSLRPTSSLRSGQRISANARVQQQFGDRFSVFAGIEGERRLTERDYLDVWQWGGSAGWILAFGSSGKRDPLTFSVTGGYLRRDYDGPDPTISATDAEWDKEKYVVGTFDVPINDGWGLQARSGYRMVDSNYDTRVFKNVHGSVALTKRF